MQKSSVSGQLPRQSHLLNLTLATKQGFGRIGGCLGLVLEEKRGPEVEKKSINNVVFELNLAASKTHLFECEMGRAGVGIRGAAGGPHTTEGPWARLRPWTAEGLRSRRELLGSAGRGF